MLCSCAEAARGACRGSAAPYRPWLWRARCQPRPDRGRTTTSGTRRFGRAGARAVSERGRARVRGGHGLVGAGRGRGWRGREKMTGKTLSMLPSIESSLIRSAAKPRQTERKRFRATQRAWTLDSRPPPEQPGAPCRRQVLGHKYRTKTDFPENACGFVELIPGPHHHAKGSCWAHSGGRWERLLNTFRTEVVEITSLVPMLPPSRAGNVAERNTHQDLFLFSRLIFRQKVIGTVALLALPQISVG